MIAINNPNYLKYMMGLNANGARTGAVKPVKNVSTEHFYRITYILLFVLGSVLCWQGTSHLLHAAA